MFENPFSSSDPVSLEKLEAAPTGLRGGELRQLWRQWNIDFLSTAKGRSSGGIWNRLCQCAPPPQLGSRARDAYLTVKVTNSLWLMGDGWADSQSAKPPLEELRARISRGGLDALYVYCPGSWTMVVSHELDCEVGWVFACSAAAEGVKPARERWVRRERRGRH